MEPVNAVHEIARWCDIAVVKIGAKGSLIATNHEFSQVPSFKVTCLDTTGAGDFFAAGFLYGLTKNLSLEQCAKIGSIAGSEVVQVIGTELSENKWNEIKDKISKI